MDVYVAYYIYKEERFLLSESFCEILGVFTSKEAAIDKIKKDLAEDEMTLEDDYTKEEFDKDILFSSKEESSEYRVEKHVLYCTA